MPTYTLLVELILVAAGFVMLRLSFRRRKRLQQTPVRKALRGVLVPDATEGESIPNSAVVVARDRVEKRPIGATFLGLRGIPSPDFAPRDIQPASEKDEAILHGSENA